MPRVKPRKADYSSAPSPRNQSRKWGNGPLSVDSRPKRYERKGHLVQEGKPKGRLKELLETPLRADAESELEALAKARADSDDFLRAMTEGGE